jgi:geranylgeranyl diphosphate synthase type II
MLSDPSLGRGIKEDSLLKALHEISTASGAAGMVAGQVQDMLSENAGPDIDTLHFIHKHKTTALLRASVRTGPLLAGIGRDKLDALTRYGDSIGLTFQVIDDILDVEGETEVIGKPRGSDEKKKKMTYPSLYGIEKSREIAQTLVTEAVSALSIFSSEADPLREIAYYLLERKS